MRLCEPTMDASVATARMPLYWPLPKLPPAVHLRGGRGEGGSAAARVPQPPSRNYQKTLLMTASKQEGVDGW